MRVFHERRSADTRQRILEVAETLFAAKGYAGAHLQAIAQEVGVQKTALYYYFPSKAALYVAVLGDMLEAFDRAVATAVQRDLPHRERFIGFIDDLNDVLAANPNYSQILIRIFVDRADVDLQELQPVVRRVIGRALEFYAEGVASGAFVKMSSRHVVQSVLGAAVFHYAARDFSARLLGVDDVFSADAVAWRRAELQRLLAGVLVEPER